MLFRSEGDRIKAAYHPSHARICTDVHRRSYSNVIKLALIRCAFHSSLDLLRLLAACSALTTVRLMHVSVARVSERAWRCSSTSQVRHIVARGCTPSPLPFLTHYWTWPHAISHNNRPAFHGLVLAEQQLMTRACQLLALDWEAHYVLDEMDDAGISCRHYLPLSATSRLTTFGCYMR